MVWLGIMISRGAGWTWMLLTMPASPRVPIGVGNSSMGCASCAVAISKRLGGIGTSTVRSEGAGLLALSPTA
eukprot:4194661-Alexandrium_andersonii.AAC.1